MSVLAASGGSGNLIVRMEPHQLIAVKSVRYPMIRVRFPNGDESQLPSDLEVIATRINGDKIAVKMMVRGLAVPGDGEVIPTAELIEVIA